MVGCWSCIWDDDLACVVIVDLGVCFELREVYLVFVSPATVEESLLDLIPFVQLLLLQFPLVDFPASKLQI